MIEMPESRLETPPIVSHLSAELTLRTRQSSSRWENISRIGRGDWIRTSDPLTPSEVLAQSAALPCTATKTMSP